MTNYHYISNIPERLRGKTGINKYNFLVLNPRLCPPNNYIRVKDWKVDKISKAAYCKIRKENEEIHIVIEKDRFSLLYDSIVAVSKLRSFTPFVSRYMGLYKSYESLTKNIDFEFRAIRHGLSHSSHALTNQKTVKMLEKLFGTKHIDLSNQKHINIFYAYFAKMLMAHDKILYEELLKRLALFKTTNNYKDFLVG